MHIISEFIACRTAERGATVNLDKCHKQKANSTAACGKPGGGSAGANATTPTPAGGASKPTTGLTAGTGPTTTAAGASTTKSG